jgi:hypothetical protein
VKRPDNVHVKSDDREVNLQGEYFEEASLRKLGAESHTSAGRKQQQTEKRAARVSAVVGLLRLDLLHHPLGGREKRRISPDAADQLYSNRHLFDRDEGQRESRQAEP